MSSGSTASRSCRAVAWATGKSSATTSTPGSGTPTAMAHSAVTRAPARPASTRPRYVTRFTRTERLLHWVHAAAFFVLLGSGLVLYLPALSSAIARRPLIKDIHFWTGISWAGAMLLIVALGNRRAIARTLREIDLFDRDDRRLLRGG